MNDLVPRGADRRTTSRRPATSRSHRHRAPQVDHCVRCLSPVGRSYRYCACCGLRLESLAGSEVQRRMISVLFVDIAGFTELAAGLEPEALRTLQIDYFRSVAEVIRRWGGVVEKYIGDAVMAVFGATGPDPNHALHAVRAGEQIVTALRRRRFSHGQRLRVRVGIATGDAMVDPRATDGGQGIVTGNVVNIACRVQSHAMVGTVAVTDATRRATGSLVPYQRLAPVRVAGRPEPVEIWRPVGPVHQITGRAGQGAIPRSALCRCTGARRTVAVATTAGTPRAPRGGTRSAWPPPNGTWPAGRWPAGTWPAGTWPAGTWPAGTWPAARWRAGTWSAGAWRLGRCPPRPGRPSGPPGRGARTAPPGGTVWETGPTVVAAPAGDRVDAFDDGRCRGEPRWPMCRAGDAGGRPIAAGRDARTRARSLPPTHRAASWMWSTGTCFGPRRPTRGCGVTGSCFATSAYSRRSSRSAQGWRLLVSSPRHGGLG